MNKSKVHRKDKDAVEGNENENDFDLLLTSILRTLVSGHHLLDLCDGPGRVEALGACSCAV